MFIQKIAVMLSATGAALATTIAMPVHAGAVPPCTRWVLKSPSLNMNLSNGQWASFDWNQDLGTQSARNGMNSNASLHAPNGDLWDGYASLLVRGNLLAGPVKWQPHFGDFGGPPITEGVIYSDFRGTIVDLGTARGSAHDNKGATVEWVGASVFDCADGS